MSGDGPDGTRRGAIIWAAWQYHRRLCDCRSTDGARCELARAISRFSRALDEAHLLWRHRARPSTLSRV